MSCKRIDLGPKITLWICNPHEEDYYIWKCEQEIKQQELDLDLERQQQLLNEQPVIVEPEIVPAEIVLSWDSYCRQQRQ